ncbi:cupin domain-containing protein [Herbaspirillum sp. GCM10030257]|uniref:cupin domain-containing protein n=1 Tax=Herbaspirillum sp. GCM10030257 TaxID=3273393 RepID=UPI0036219FA9
MHNMQNHGIANVYQDIPAALADELIQTLAGAGGVRIERIVSRGHCSSPGFWYEQAEHEWVLLLKGEACLRFERDDRKLLLAEGDHVTIPAGERHRVEWTRNDGTDTVWLAVFYAQAADK